MGVVGGGASGAAGGLAGFETISFFDALGPTITNCVDLNVCLKQRFETVTISKN